MKKIYLSYGLLAFTLFLSACNKSPKAEMAEYADGNSGATKMSASN